MHMDLNDFRHLVILVDKAKNIALFPVSKTKEPIPNDPDGLQCYGYFPAYVPTELGYPYSRAELAHKLENVMGQWCLYPCFCEEENEAGMTFEEKYYGASSFRSAMQGKKMLDIGWDDVQGKYVTLSLPCKSGYAYLGIITETLSHDAGWDDFADAVIELIGKDLSELKSFKTFKGKLNL